MDDNGARGWDEGRPYGWGFKVQWFFFVAARYECDAQNKTKKKGRRSTEGEGGGGMTKTDTPPPKAPLFISSYTMRRR